MGLVENTCENTASFHIPERVLDAPLLSFDLPEVIKRIKSEEKWKMGERDAITLLKSLYLRIVLIALHGQMEINFHQSGNVISVQLIEGEVNFQTENQSVILKQGGLLTIHENMRHTLIAIKESVFLLTIAICPHIKAEAKFGGEEV